MPNTVFEDVQEIQPWCRISPTMSSPLPATAGSGAPAGDNPGQRAALSGQQGSGGQSRTTIPFSSMSRFPIPSQPWPR